MVLQNSWDIHTLQRREHGNTQRAYTKKPGKQETLLKLNFLVQYVKIGIVFFYKYKRPFWLAILNLHHNQATSAREVRFNNLHRLQHHQ